jgi:predicted transcriptional regulator
VIKLETVAELRDHAKQPAAKEALNVLLINGLSPQEMATYAWIALHKDISTNDLCEAVGRPQNHIGNIVSKLLRLGLVVRVVDSKAEWKYLYRIAGFTNKP